MKLKRFGSKGNQITEVIDIYKFFTEHVSKERKKKKKTKRQKEKKKKKKNFFSFWDRNKLNQKGTKQISFIINLFPFSKFKVIIFLFCNRFNFNFKLQFSLFFFDYLLIKLSSKLYIHLIILLISSNWYIDLYSFICHFFFLNKKKPIINNFSLF